MATIKMLRISPLKKPELIEVVHTLDVLRELVGGAIQAVDPWEDAVCLLCDEEGKMKGYQANRVLEDENGKPYDILVGTFYICGLTEDAFGSISDEMAKKYTEKFQYPELFIRTPDGDLYVQRIGKNDPPVRIA